ncbi:putative polypeptide N-acetylgalactosaminyltransferase 9 [Folsomia candida]|uniref:putative polypeptide N-acetylgalactosaminyltransferase 9 n=1 Tax=Folsomia candida TaxID=158441 RepID=UPI0016055E4D|nr:putative polypeptide N-acetylgalactosaminyltransferase 9 [Folsomia candida]
MFGDTTNDPNLVHFENEQSFIDRFGEDPRIAKMFNKTSPRTHNEDIPGDMGIPVFVENPTEKVRKIIKDGYNLYGYNKYVSDLIPIERRLPDRRNEWCFTPNRVSKMLLPTTVIMCVYNEALSVLLRTLQSIISRSPPHLLAEIILIDDFSDHDDLRVHLKEIMRHISKVKLLRLPKREGLIRCRLYGALIAHAPVLTFLDSHVEVAEGWLEPLLDQVTKNWRSIAIPVFNLINPSTFACNFSDQPVSSVGGFKWDLMFAFNEISSWHTRNVNTSADPIPSPTMSGGFFSIHRDFFSYLGKYDDQFEIWGGENIELSFKTWMCGGSIYILPCSHVAHLERIRSVYSRETVKRNNARLAAVWLDEFAHFYFVRAGRGQGLPNYGDVSSRLALRRSLNCSSFDWYLKNVIPSMFNPKSALAYGEVLFYVILVTYVNRYVKQARARN